MVHRCRWALIVSLLVVGADARAQSDDGAGLVAIRAARLLDVRAGRYIENPVVVVRGERIESVTANGQLPAGARLIDLGDATLLPGLIDAHSHLLKNNTPRFFDGTNLVRDVTVENTATRVLRGAAMAREDLEAGITMVRDAGNSGINGDVALRDAIENGYVPGPRIVACTRALSPIGGQLPRLPSENQALVENEYVPVSGADEARKAVRQAIYYGADCIKVIVDAGDLLLSREELEAIVAEAHRYGRTVAAHATSEAAIRVATDARVNSVEHGFSLTEDLAKRMAASGVFLVPNDYPVEVYLMGVPRTPEQRRESEQAYRGFTVRMRKRLATAVHSEVRIAAGSDMYNDIGMSRGAASLLIFGAYAEAGMPPIEIVRAATINAAELLGRAADVGSVERGKYADIIAVPGDPLRDALVLQRARFVMKGGRVVRNDSARP
jgi:imidazolonepropionase-like amidohydrolase